MILSPRLAALGHTRVHLMEHLMVLPMVHLMVQLMMLLSFFRKSPALLRRRVSPETFDDFSPYLGIFGALGVRRASSST